MRSLTATQSFSFPRVCGGDPNQFPGEVVVLVLFPACAGVILVSVSVGMRIVTFPRVCGGDPHHRGMEQQKNCFSPRVRG